MTVLLDHRFEDWELHEASKDDLIRLCHRLREWAQEHRAQEMQNAYDEGYDEGYRDGKAEERERNRENIAKMSPALATTLLK